MPSGFFPLTGLATATVATIGEWSSAYFNGYIGIAVAGAGLIIGPLLAWFLIKIFIAGIHWLVNFTFHPERTDKDIIAADRAIAESQRLDRDIPGWH